MRFLDFQTQTQHDIATVIHDTVAGSCDEQAILDELTKTNPELRPVRIPVKALDVQPDWTVNLANVLHYASLNVKDSPEVLVDGHLILDGHHRLLAAMIRQESHVLCLNLAEFLKPERWPKP